MDENAFPAAGAAGPARAAAASMPAIAMAIGVAVLAGAAAMAAIAMPSERFFAAGGRQMQRHADAVRAFQARSYAVAYGRFADLANEGHAPSALMALAMVCHGPTLFGSEWSATPGQLQRWTAMAVHDVRERGVAIAEHDRGE